MPFSRHPSRTAASNRRRLGVALVAATLPGALLLGAGPADAAGRAPHELPADQAALGVVAPSLHKATGTVEVSVALSRKPLAEVVTKDAVRLGGLPSKAEQKAQTAAVRTQQRQVTAGARALGARVTGNAEIAENVVTLSVSASRIDELAKLPGVVSV